MLRGVSAHVHFHRPILRALYEPTNATGCCVHAQNTSHGGCCCSALSSSAAASSAPPDSADAAQRGWEYCGVAKLSSCPSGSSKWKYRSPGIDPYAVHAHAHVHVCLGCALSIYLSINAWVDGAAAWAHRVEHMDVALALALG